MPTDGRSSVAESALIVAIPIRSPVKLPGPVATANRSTSDRVMFVSARSLSMSPSSVLECEIFGSPLTTPSNCPPRTMATLPDNVAVSTLRINASDMLDQKGIQPHRPEDRARITSTVDSLQFQYDRLRRGRGGEFKTHRLPVARRRRKDLRVSKLLIAGGVADHD